MTTASETVVFFGSGPVAAESLALLAQTFTIEAVVTKPKPSHHRGVFPVIDTAQELGIPVHTVSNKAELSTLVATRPFTSRLGVLIDFGIIVTQDVIDYFPLGILNSHFSVLPEWRGADPITFAILSGQEVTGVSLMFLVEAMDEGPLYAYGEQRLDGTETTPILTTKLIQLSNALLKNELPRLFKDPTRIVSQDVTKRQLSYSRKLTKADGIIDWNKSAEVIEREIRGFVEWPKSTTQLAGKDVVITAAHVIDASGKAGSPEIIDKQLVIYCGEKALAIDTLKPAGKKEMTAAAFLAGYRHLL